MHQFTYKESGSIKLIQVNRETQDFFWNEQQQLTGLGISRGGYTTTSTTNKAKGRLLDMLAGIITQVTMDFLLVLNGLDDLFTKNPNYLNATNFHHIFASTKYHFPFTPLSTKSSNTLISFGISEPFDTNRSPQLSSIKPGYFLK